MTNKAEELTQVETFKLLSHDLVELIDITQDQVDELLKKKLVEQIPSKHERIYRLISKSEGWAWTLQSTPEAFIGKLMDRLKKEKPANLLGGESIPAMAGPFSFDTLSDIYGQVEENGIVVVACLMNARSYAELRKEHLAATPNGPKPTTLDLVTSQGIMQLGCLAFVWGVPLVVTKELEMDHVVVFGEAKHKFRLDFKIIR